MEPNEVATSPTAKLRFVDVPASTPSPIVAAFGVAMVFAGMATHAIVAATGALLAIVGAVGWFMDVLPKPAHERVAAVDEVPEVSTSRREVEHVDGAAGIVRANLPITFHPVSAGIVGGLAGGIAMAAIAAIYGWVSGRGVFYPIDLLAAEFFPSATVAELSRFNLTMFVIAFLIHAIASCLVGLLYGALLPMLPRRPILLGGLIAPVLWTGILHSTLALINPMLAVRVDWLWFAISQFAFGIVAGFVVSRSERVTGAQPLPWQMRAGIEAPGLVGEPPDKEQKHE